MDKDTRINVARIAIDVTRIGFQGANSLAALTELLHGLPLWAAEEGLSFAEAHNVAKEAFRTED